MSLRRTCTEQGPSGVDQVRTLVEHLLIDKEILLLRSYACSDMLYILVSEKLQNPECLAVDGLHGTKKRCLLVQCLTGVGAECCRNAKGMILDKCIGCGIPCCITPGFKGGAKSAAGEG